jgi:hypothetical protein
MGNARPLGASHILDIASNTEVAVMPIYRRTYDAKGNPMGTVEYSFRRQPQNRMGCLGKTVLFILGAFILLWPLDLQPQVLSAGAAWGVVVGWWCLLVTIPLTLWLRPRIQERNRQHDVARRERAERERELAGRPDVDLREAGWDRL